MSVNRTIAKSAIVIGGGIAGCSTAYALAKRGIAVTLIERHDALAQEASGNPIATLYPKLSIKPSMQSALALQGFTFTLNLLQQLPNSAAFFDACGQIQLAFNAREQLRQDALKTQYAFLKAIDAKTASEIAGITLQVGGLYLPQAGWLKPQDLCKALVNSPLITTLCSTTVTNIEKKQAHWQLAISNLHLQADVLEAEALVLCNANDVQQLDDCLSVVSTPVRGQINFFAATLASQSIKTIICGTQYLSPAVDGLHSIGASYAPNDANPQLSADDTHENLQALRQISPEIYNSMQSQPAHGRVAWRSQTQDYMPLAGQLINEQALRKNLPRYNAKPADLPWESGLYINAGHGSKGMITAPICAELIANLISNQSLIVEEKLASKLNPSRFLLRELGLKQLAACLYDSN